MNEFEKDELLEEEGISPDLEENEDDLKKELEDIRDMMQEELDKAMAEDDEAEDDTIIIQELDDIADEETQEHELDESEKCECCGEKAKSDKYGENYPYCDDCRDMMKKYPLRASGILATAMMIVFFFLAMYMSSAYLEDVLTVAQASENYKAGNIITGMQGYYSYFNSAASSNKAISKRAFNELIEGYVKTGYYSDAVQLIETYYNETALSMPWNKEYKKIVDDSAVLNESYRAVSEIAEPALSGGEYDYDEIIAALDDLKNVNPKEEGKSETVEKYSEVFIEYYKYIVMSLHGESVEAQLEQLKKVDAVGEDYQWAYLSNYCAVAAKAGNEALMNECFDRLVEINRQDMNAYIAKASYYRYLDTPDADKIIEICNQAAENVGTNDISYKQYLAIAYLLKGEGALALEEMQSLMSMGSYSVQTCNLYALCALYNGNTDIYKEMKQILETNGYAISELVEKYKADKITIEEALTDKGGDI